MKKKILYLFILGCIFILPNSIEARSAEACSKEKNQAILQLNEAASGLLGIKYAHLFRSAGTTYYRMKLDNRMAMCISHGKKASSSNQYKIGNSGELEDYQIKGFGFYVNGSYEGRQDIKWAIAQAYVWFGNDPNFVDNYLIPLINMDTTMSKKDSRQVALTVMTTIMGSGGNFYLWKNQSFGSAGQDMISTLSGCVDEEEQKETCPKGQMELSNGELICAVGKGNDNVVNSDFSYKPQAGNRSDVHIKYGEERALSGNAYCRIYCSETGSATMPGAFGEKLQIGSYMIWPTSENNFNSKFYKTAYPLKFSGTLLCHMGIIPDETEMMPFSCKEDPIWKYTQIYKKYKTSDKYKSETNNTTDKTYHRKTDYNSLEKLRLKYINGNGVPSSPNIDAFKGWCNNIYTKKEYSTGSPHFLGSKTEVGSALYNLKKAQDEYEEIKKEEGNFTEDEKTNDNPAWNDFSTRKSAAIDAVTDAQAEVDRLNKASDTCASYINDFETMRQIILTYKECAEYAPSTSLYEFSSTATLEYEDAEQYSFDGGIFADESSEDITYDSEYVAPVKNLIENKFKEASLKFDDLYKQEGEEKSHSGTLDDKVKIIGTYGFKINKSESYTLDTGYKYLNKDSLKYEKNITAPNANYISFDKTVIPSSFKNEIGKNYYLKISNISFGMAGFTNNSKEDYACPVQFTKQRTPDTCICPEGTANAGKDLTCMNIDQDITCPDAQIQYCEDTSVEIPEECPPGDKTIYCPSPNDNISIGSCINSGMSYADCVAKYCPGAEDIKCPDTYGSSASNMDEQLRDCVQVKMAQGMSKAQAIAVCEPLVCPGGRRIIYRTIRLENPFPSYDSDTKVTQANLQVGMFNNTVKGRYPGSNWNGVLTVYNKIRNNRGTATKDKNTAKNTNKGLVGTTIYQTKTPLYTFVLNGEKISNIRDYNKNQQKGYNDFNLDCTKNNSVACVSSFVHNPLYGLTGGECQNVSKQKSSFYSCAKR